VSLFDGLEDIFTGVMGEMAELVSEDSEPVSVKGIFVERWAPEEAGIYGDFEGQVSTLDIRKADLPDCFGEDGHVHLRARRYRCIGVRPDEFEMVKLVLRAAGAAPSTGEVA
jgi:hypothetical protein